MREGNTVLNTTLVWSWNGEVTSRINIHEFSLSENGQGVFRISFGYGSETYTQTVRIISTQPHYGGKRWWFVCPHSGKRCLFLFFSGANKGFYCRRTLRLKYDCQNEDASYRALRRFRKACDRYGTLDYEPWFPKPKGMHLKTYARRMAYLDELEWRADNTFLAWAGRYLKM